jgi:hypothetical protein
MRHFFNRFIHRILWTFTQMFPSRVREIILDDRPYLRRFYITSKTDKERPFGLYLHYFHRGDEDRELHNHPWKKSYSLILTGGYDEERALADGIAIRSLRTGRINVIRDTDFHRIMLNKSYGAHTWTLFMSGARIPKTPEGYKDWGFWNRETDKYIPHQEFDTVKNREYSKLGD